MRCQLLDLSLLPRWRHGLATIATLGAIDFLPCMLLRFSHQRINGLVRFFDDLLHKRRKLLLVAIGLLSIRLDVDGGAHGKKVKASPSYRTATTIYLCCLPTLEGLTGAGRMRLAFEGKCNHNLIFQTSINFNLNVYLCCNGATQSFNRCPPLQ